MDVHEKYHQLTLVGTKTKPKRCGSCGNKTEWPIIVKNAMGAIGTTTYCTECGVYGFSNKKVYMSIGLDQIVYGIIHNLVNQMVNA